MAEINLIKQSLDVLITYSIANLPLPNLLLMPFNKSLTRQEHYSLSKALYPAGYLDAQTASEWRLARAIDEGFSPVDEGDMILIERLPDGETVYHWSFARNWQTDKLWAFDKEMLPEA